MRMSIMAATAVTASVLFAASAAQAAFVVQEGNIPQFDDNVIANGCDAGVGIAGPALQVAGCLNGDRGQQVLFTSDEAITYSGGQATVEAEDGNGFSYLKIEVVGTSFDSLILNINASEDGQVQFGDGTDLSGFFDLSSGGANFFTITGADLPFIEFWTTDASVSVDIAETTRQVRIGGVGSVQISEPALGGLLGLGMLGIAMARRRA
ncbi:hypothetical protein [Futiania mangrovi]|uniref:PEP-CTERM sorting domain-containing protein n=1 Tax=Futiania mangrovi TaxID=2959716 RepID=A0A9J6PBI5_9PROT|nr:hypothetical protein [Futiania mangrovii]MCP1335088.1 hypothetical protein [Futiania mangrovii]